MITRDDAVWESNFLSEFLLRRETHHLTHLEVVSVLVKYVVYHSSEFVSEIREPSILGLEHALHFNELVLVLLVFGCHLAIVPTRLKAHIVVWRGAMGNEINAVSSWG